MKKRDQQLYINEQSRLNKIERLNQESNVEWNINLKVACSKLSRLDYETYKKIDRELIILFSSRCSHYASAPHQQLKLKYLGLLGGSLTDATDNHTVSFTSMMANQAAVLLWSILLAQLHIAHDGPELLYTSHRAAPAFVIIMRSAI